ncbi:MAG TPA: fumarylacetoacetate hydrolase family protein [Pirellulales bacterium]|jgi:2-dehydro-3-deoxy-D-arabinonate dehydratase
MQLAKLRIGTQGNPAVGLVTGGGVQPLDLAGEFSSLGELLEVANVREAVESLKPMGPRLPLDSVTLLAPIDRQEIWAAGVTYTRSKVARMEESTSAAVFYDKVYVAERPELFFKGTPHRVVGHGQQVRMRADSKWNVPEPELALVLSSKMKLVGFTIGNDMSSRDIEGENPLYLPQAKVYDGSCALGPVITLADAMPAPDEIVIRMVIRREGKVEFEGGTTTAQMARSFSELIGWLKRDNSFPDGAILLTGTGIVPADDFTLAPLDSVEITIEGIGTLRNFVVQQIGMMS